MNWCKSCILPDSRPGVVLNSKGICGACKNALEKEDVIDWNKREHEFYRLLDSVKNNCSGYDCLIPVSGGKDSTWQVVKCLQLGLKPLTLTWKTPGRTVIGQQNLDNLVSLGVDHIDWQISPVVEKKFMLKAFEKYGSTAIPMHMAIHAMPLTIAAKMNIPLVIYGENSAFEYGSGEDNSLTGYRLDSNWRKKYGVTHGTTAIDWIDNELTEEELIPYFGPTDEELDEKQIKAVFLGHYYKWDVNTSLEVATKHGFKSGRIARTGIYDYADIDDNFISVHHWMKWFKFGITRSFDNYSIEIRAGRITRNEALNFLLQRGEERPLEDIEAVCSFMGIEVERFFEIAEKHRNLEIWKKVKNKWCIPDFILKEWLW